MNRPFKPWGFLGAALVAALLAAPQLGQAHGGVVAEEDVCLLRMGFLQAHFTLYLPDGRGAEEFCEEVPDVGPTLFVIEYLHEMMKEMPLSFRVISDDQVFGIFANWDDVQSIGNLEAQTVLHRPLVAEPTGVVTLRHDFAEAGGYIGIVEAENPANGKAYNAVFYFEVGNVGYGLIPLFVGLIAAAQVGFWLSTGTLQRFARRLQGR
ncbi:MAG: hypothetical protein F4220_10045 [Gammaproteobacteria bacterium]|nr:hypothetical protein [Gammaproteobacteria bacterium]